MKLEHIELRNFRQYFGRHRLDFSQDENRNVTVIHGVNGAGKTSLFLALNWCLYGAGVESIGQIISKEAMLRAKPSETVETVVMTVFIHDGIRYHASRKLTGQKRPDNQIIDIPRDGEFVLSRVPMSGVAKKVDNPIGVMNMIMPSNVRTYFFFDGEKIDSFARPEKADEVRFAVFQVLNLSVLERAKNHLGLKADDLRRELKNISSGELERLLEKDVTMRENGKALTEKKEQLEQEIRAAQQHAAEVNQTLETYKEVEALQKQYNQYADEIGVREQEMVKLTERIRQMASSGYVSLYGDVIERALAVLEEKRRRGEIPSNVRQPLIEDLLSQHMCICGRPFSDHDDAYNHLVHMLKTAVPSNLEDDVLETNGRLRSLLERGPELQENLNSAMTDKAELQDFLTSLYARQDDIKRQMKDAPQTEISALARQRDRYNSDIDSYKGEVVRCDLEIEENNTVIRGLEKEIAAAKKTDERAQLLDRKLKLAQDATYVVSEVYEKFAENKRLEIEQRTREIFQHLAWKSEHFQDVCLTSDYQLEVIDRYGSPARPELSAGERQVLSLSFITAMADVAQREAPLVMDTPFGRLSSAHREAITASLPHLAPQLVLLVTDEELRDQALENLSPRIGNQYRLNFDPKSSCTTIEEL